MKLSLLLAIYSAVASALSTGHSDQRILGNVASADKFLIELEPGVTKWVSEDDKWELRRVCYYLLKASCPVIIIFERVTFLTHRRMA